MENDNLHHHWQGQSTLKYALLFFSFFTYHLLIYQREICQKSSSQPSPTYTVGEEMSQK